MIASKREDKKGLKGGCIANGRLLRCVKTQVPMCAGYWATASFSSGLPEA